MCPYVFSVFPYEVQINVIWFKLKEMKLYHSLGAVLPSMEFADKEHVFLQNFTSDR